MWVGKMSPAKLRKKAIELARKHFDAGCKYVCVTVGQCTCINVVPSNQDPLNLRDCTVEPSNQDPPEFKGLYSGTL